MVKTSQVVANSRKRPLKEQSSESMPQPPIKFESETSAALPLKLRTSHAVFRELQREMRDDRGEKEEASRVQKAKSTTATTKVKKEEGSERACLKLYKDLILDARIIMIILIYICIHLIHAFASTT